MTSMIHVSRPKSAKDFERYYDLRWRILRQPWNQPRGSERDEFEGAAEHVWARDDDHQLVGVGRLHLLSSTKGQIRYMATEPAVRGKGFGRLLLGELERIALSKRVDWLMLNARKPAVGFYRKMGYTVTGEADTLFGVIEHVRMQKDMKKTIGP